MPELRRDPITGRWVIIATDRAISARPILSAIKFKSAARAFARSATATRTRLRRRFSPTATTAARPIPPAGRCASCPINFRRWASKATLNRQGEGIYDKMNGIGAHEVIIETPQHNLTLATMPTRQVEDVLWAYRDRILDLKKDRRFKYILIFKNHGEAAGASLEHPHSQLIALPVVPKRVREEVDGAREHYNLKERCIFCDIIRQETGKKRAPDLRKIRLRRLAPFAPRFPFETWIMPKVHQCAFEESQKAEFEQLAPLLKDMLHAPRPRARIPAYNYIIHTAPIGESAEDYYHWHLEIMPKLTKVAGFEWGTGFYINPTPPEEAAKFLREAAQPAEAPAEARQAG